MFRPPKLARVHGNRWTARLGIRLTCAPWRLAWRGGDLVLPPLKRMVSSLSGSTLCAGNCNEFHDVITYSWKAKRHKQVYPFCVMVSRWWG